MTVEELRVLTEALTQFIDNQADVDEPDPRDLRNVEIATRLLDNYERQLVEQLT